MSKGSGKLRTQIGWSSRRIKDLLEEEEIPKEKEIRDSSDVDELIHVIGTTIHLGEKLSIEIKRIKELERQWKEIIVNDSKELEKKQAIHQQAYGGSLRLKNTLLQQLKDLPSIHLSRSPKDLQTFCNSASKVFHQLTSLDCQMDNTMTAALLTSKLPKRILAKLYANDTDSPLSAGQLITQLSSISTRENVVDDMYISNHKDEFDKNRSLTTMSAVAKHRPNNHHQHQDISYGSPKLCEYCASPRMHHRSHDCRQYKTKNERKQRANELKLCYRCLQSGHSAKFCRQQCTQCRGGHHLSLCRKILGAFNDSTFGNSSSAPGQQQRDFLPNTTGRGQGFQPQQVTIWNNQQQRRPSYQPNQQFQSNQNQQPIQQNQRQQHQQP
uniref:CCHC-type domain-containing protein n=1 Tax=Caenorhabditis tropicalis TaxID=1561998 RepID=A0A1I7T686_9PELO